MVIILVIAIDLHSRLPLGTLLYVTCQITLDNDFGIFLKSLLHWQIIHLANLPLVTQQLSHLSCKIRISMLDTNGTDIPDEKSEGFNTNVNWNIGKLRINICGLDNMNVAFGPFGLPINAGPLIPWSSVHIRVTTWNTSSCYFEDALVKSNYSSGDVFWLTFQREQCAKISHYTSMECS